MHIAYKMIFWSFKQSYVIKGIFFFFFSFFCLNTFKRRDYVKEKNYKHIQGEEIRKGKYCVQSL